MKSIYLRNFAVTAALVTICFLVIGFSIFGIGRSLVIEEYKTRMESCADEAARAAEAISQKEELSGWTMRMNLSTLGSSTGNHVFLTDAEGLVVSCSDRAMRCEHIGQSVCGEFFEQLQQEGQAEGLSDLGGFYAKDRFVVARTITAQDGERRGFVFVSYAMDKIYDAWSTFLSMTAAVALLVLIIALVMSLLYSKRMSRPLDAMAEASRKFARGDFSVRVKQEDDPTDEMGALIESFNKMADSLESAEARRSEFIANISHELRTPMTTIAGFADGILDGTIPHEEEDKYLRSIRDETRRLSRLVREMLDLSQMKSRLSDPARRQVFDLTELICQTMLSFEERAGKKNLDVDPQLPDDPIMVVADRDAITQVVYNLIDNAVKFAREGSCIVIRLYKEDGKAYVSVRDEGETIPPEDLPFIFDRFHKSDRSRSLDKDGVGLGLYLVKAIINSHDEDIAVKSADGVTEFVFTLSLAQG
ncbi:MAG: HAMP domain-containing histidine kinase [Oscillospiraceae bacterium]|nr:HAMP domain-containing histidine kinase [Oscillospiraceae bacterium]